MNKNTIFNRHLLKNIMESVRKYVPKELIESSWGYHFRGSKQVEFHISKCEGLPKGFYWHGRGTSITEAKIKGWQAYLDSIQSK
jgi:hypothetical protein